MRGRGLLAALVVAAACRGSEGSHRDRLVIGRAADATNLDPARAVDIESLEISEHVFGRLVRFAPGRLDPEPDLATSWTVSPDGTVWTFELRRGVRFHDGTPLDAEAVVFSFERQLVADHPAHAGDFLWARAYQNIRRVKAEGPFRVRFEIDRPFAPFLANLAMGPGAIVSPAAVRRSGPMFGRRPVGAGPYRLKEWVPGDRITLVRNPDYWDSAPRTNTLVFLVLAGAQQRLQALESGTADVVQQVPPDELTLLRLHPDLKVARAPAAQVAYLAFNTQRRPLDDPRVRRALSHAVPHDAIVRFVYQGMAAAALGPMPPNVWGSRSDVVTYGYDLDRARRLLATAGVDPATVRPLKLVAPRVPRPYLPAPERVAAAVQSNFAALGLRVEVVLLDPVPHMRALWAGEHDLALHGWFADNGDPDSFLYTLLDSDNTTGSRPSNIAFYRNGYFHDLITQAQRSADRTERERLYSQAQAILATEAPWVPLAHPEVVFAMHDRVRGLVLQPSGMALYRWTEAR